MSKKTKALQETLEGMTWVDAKSYASFAPHAYVVLGKQPSATKALFVEVMDRVWRDGVDEDFAILGSVRTYRYLHLGEYKYWVMTDDPDSIRIINRVPVAASAS